MKDKKQEYLRIINKIIKYKCDQWLPSYLKNLKEKKEIEKEKHIIFFFTDHFEPANCTLSKEIENKRIIEWCKKYEKIIPKFKDSDGKFPKHTWFYHPKLYNKNALKKLSDMCSKGYGEIEYHLHHSGDDKESLRRTIIKDIGFFNEEGAMISQQGKTSYGFIHGMWALDNSMSEYCGVNEELAVLKETGCYADFTFPAFGQEAQPSKINSIYYATESFLPKSYDQGIDVEVGKKESGDLMIFEGPLSINSTERVFEYGDGSNIPFSPDRIGAWLDADIHVKGRPEWIFIKIFGHTIQDSEFFFRNMRKMHRELEKRFKKNNYKLHYVTAREAYNIVKAAENGKKGNPNDYRDYLISKPLNILKID